MAPWTVENFDVLGHRGVENVQVLEQVFEGVKGRRYGNNALIE
jgi:hypothetical protein